MRKTLIPAFLVAFATLASGQVGQPVERTVELKDGGRVAVQKDGTMVHLDAAGNRVRMKDGQMMEAKDGSRLMMKNNAVWKQISEHGTLKPGH